MENRTKTGGHLNSATMAASLDASTRRSPGSSAASLRRSDGKMHGEFATLSVDTLVNHLLAAKRSLSSITLVLRADELINAARIAHEDTIVLAAQSRFLLDFINDQIKLLIRIRQVLQHTYEWGKRDFKKLVKSMDEVDSELGNTMDMLRGTTVQGVLRPKGEERRNLLDFIDEGSVDAMRDSMKKSIQELQAIQQSFDGDLLRLEDDIRSLNRIMLEASGPPHTHNIQMADLYAHSNSMADCLASLTRHFDLCVTAIRTTEGAAALARRKAAEITQSQGGESVSISGVITEQESNVPGLEPQTAEERANMLQVVSEDAQVVQSVLIEMEHHLEAVETQCSELEGLAQQSKRAYLCMLEAYAALRDVEDRLSNYVAAEEDFRNRWEMEKEIVSNKLGEMREMKDFYDRYANAYDGLLFEVERRRNVDEKVMSIWRKAQESVDKILVADRAARDTFRQDVGEFLPTDLWVGMQGFARRWKVVEAPDGPLDGPPDDLLQGGRSEHSQTEIAAYDTANTRPDESSRSSYADISKRRPLQNGARPTG